MSGIGTSRATSGGERYWSSGTFQGWGNITYIRGADSTTGWSLKFYE